MKIRVPATTANLGPGFDSFGLALTMYLELEVLEETKEWKIEHELDNIPRDETNLIIKTATHVCPNLSPHHLKMTTDIPTARGLGSSSSAIVAGIELANQLGHLNLSKEKIVEIATELEGHPDNVAPAILGGFVVANKIEEHIYYTQHHFPECELIVAIPNYELLTSASRQVLPERLTYEYAVEASSIANVALSSLLSGNLEQACFLMEQDKWHEPFRAALVPELKRIREEKNQLGFYTALLSGAGPTILILCSKESLFKTKEFIKDKFKTFDVQHVRVQSTGVEIVA
ncbi:homoserine kinase [Vagococcus carniphilus]|uniref:Homoserine kinase n=1 Tax=Vagococcus carniphilus TaxID=218144 RepID=A0AAW8U1M3_9ENTE|nr:homoserine kinase [Vagococcus carniphilus]MDT2814807.1 homoserine kinase [Vagococcus carniphilus]MDT2832681.1 homoserine kinase [Vagococcus carniphilus]MDT2849532.1 homoserine kinase [Vagococcus carniphilus]MDT2864794.1 homoserine kinase [Vagococcus carniphilus]